MAKIIIQRTNEVNNRFRNYNIYIDDKFMGKIANGQSVEFEMTDETHMVEARIDWCSSPTIIVSKKGREAKTIQVGGFKYAKWLMPVTLGIIGLHALFSNFFNFDYFMFLILPAFLFIIYYLTIGRKKYLTIKEI